MSRAERPVITPLGKFRSCKAAAAAHGLRTSEVNYRLKKGVWQYDNETIYHPIVYSKADPLDLEEVTVHTEKTIYTPDRAYKNITAACRVHRIKSERAYKLIELGIWHTKATLPKAKQVESVMRDYVLIDLKAHWAQQRAVQLNTQAPDESQK